MGAQTDIKWIHKELDQVKDESLLEAIKNMLKYRTKKRELERISIEQYNKELDQAEKEIEAGDYLTTNQLRKKAKKWGR